MTNWRKLVPTFFVFAIAALCVPALASAQYGRGGGGGRGGGYDNRDLKDAIKRVKDHSGDFRKHLDSALDRSRLNGTRREDEINGLAKEFQQAADDLKGRYNDRDPDRARGDAQRLLDIGDRIERVMDRARLDNRAESDWAQIRPDMSEIARGYGIDYRGGGGGGGGRGRHP